MNRNLLLPKLLTQKIKYYCGNQLQTSMDLTDFKNNYVNKIFEAVGRSI